MTGKSITILTQGREVHIGIEIERVYAGGGASTEGNHGLEHH